MRSIFLLGGFFGFLLVALTGWLSGRAVDLVLRDAALGALACAFLFRWFWGMWVKALVHVVETKRAEARAKADAEAAASAKPVMAAKPAR